MEPDVELDPWEQFAPAPAEQPQVEQPQQETVQELDPWEQFAQPAPQAAVPQDVRPEDMRDPATGIPGGVASPRVTDQQALQDFAEGRSDELPVFNTGVYDQLPKTGNVAEDNKRAQALFEAYKAAGEVGPTGAVSYKGTVVNPPNQQDIQAGRTADVGFSDLVFNSGRGVAKNALMTAAALMDQTIEFQSGTNPQLTKKVDDYISDRPAAGSTLDSIIMDGSQMAMGAIAGYKGGKAVGNQIRNTPDLYKETTGISRILANFGSLVGAATTAQANTDTMIVGQNSMLGELVGGTIWEGTLVEGNQPSAELLNKKYNVFVDELVAGGLIEGLVRGSAGISNIVKRFTYDQIVPMFSKSAQEEEAMNMILEGLNKGDEAGRAQVAGAIKKFKDVLIRIGNEDVADYAAGRTTMSAIEEGLSKLEPTVADRAMQIESGARGGGKPALDVKITEPVEKFRGFQEEMAQAKGGAETIEAMRGKVVEQGMQEAEGIRGKVVDQKEAVRTSEEGVRARLRSDPTFGETVRKMEEAAGFGSTIQRSVDKEDVMRDVRTAAEVITKKKTQLYEDLPEGLPIDEESFGQAMRSANEYLPKEVTDLIENEGTILDFKTLNNKIVPALSRRISQLYRQPGNEDAIDALSSLRRHITEDQAEYAAKTGTDPELVRKLTEAQAYYRDKYAPFANQEPLSGIFQELADKSRKNFPENRRYALQKKLGEAVEMPKDRDKAYSTAVLDLLDEGGMDSKKITNVWLGDVGQKLSARLVEPDGIDNISPLDIFQELGGRGAILTERNPEMVQQVTQLLDDLKAAKGDVKLQREILKDVEDMAKKEETALFETSLRKFITRDTAGNLSPRGNGYDIMRRMFNEEGKEEEVMEIARRIRASGDPIAQKGLESAYVSYLKEAFDSASSPQGNQKLLQRLTNTDGIKSLQSYGKEIFENPEELQAYVDIAKFIGRESSKRTSMKLPLSNKNMITDDARGALNMLTTWIFGVLNPKSARIRAAYNTLLKKSDANTVFGNIIQEIHRDPDYALDLLERAGKKHRDRTSTETKDNIYRILVNSGIYGEEPEDKQTFDDSWAETFGNIEQGVRTISDEMGKLIPGN